MSENEGIFWNKSGRYSDVEEVGCGGQGKVFRAFDNERKRYVAIKTIRLDREDETTSARFHQEILVLSRLSHPNVVSLLEDGSANEHNFYVMDYVEGYSLLEYLENEKPVAEEIIEIFILLCDALDSMHQAGVLHRDLKPDNVRVTKDGKPMVIDFGLVLLTEQEVERMTKTGHFVGTLNYMAPEVLLRAEYDKASDVYQLGALLYKALSGKLPLSPMNIIALARGDKVKPTPIKENKADIDGQLASVVDKAVAFKVEERYKNAQELRKDLSACLGKTSAISGLTNISRPQENRPKRSILLPIFTLALSLLLLHFFISSKEPLELRGMRLKSLGELTLLFHGKPQGDCSLSFKRPGENEKRQSLSLVSLQPLPGKTWAITITLKEPFVEKTEVSFKGGGIEERKIVDPSALVRELFAPFDDIERKEFIDFLSWCRGTRQRLFLSQKEVGYEETKMRLKEELRRHLKRFAFDEERCRLIGLIVPKLAQRTSKEKVSRQLLPLRFIESALCSHGSIAPPWPSVTRSLGFRFEKASTPLERAEWKVVDRVVLTKVIEGKTSWTWLTDNERLDGNSKSGFDDLMISMTMKKVINNRSVLLSADERYPTLETTRCKEEIILNVSDDYCNPWPPKAAYLAFDLRLLHPTTSFVLTLNNGEPIHVTQPGSSALPPIEHVQKRMRVIVPINGKTLKVGDNHLSMCTKTMPGQIPYWLIAIREVDLLFGR